MRMYAVIATIRLNDKYSEERKFEYMASDEKECWDIWQEYISLDNGFKCNWEINHICELWSFPF